ncbi:hypothetical protein SAMN05444277_1178 [Parafilimonas terrae]|uniref:Uncharacterized protein n=1 Tax=Parafilimonas terrae TaxID=1465490 RepID=A0A1I5Z696_9BACT|nr:hypothetical protein SAMN05444277_1178 [Parafilimonas terrae]
MKAKILHKRMIDIINSARYVDNSVFNLILNEAVYLKFSSLTHTSL